jgi:hypothetical protein
VGAVDSSRQSNHHTDKFILLLSQATHAVGVLNDRLLVSKYVRFHKPVVMRETGMTEAEYENIYHPCAIVQKLKMNGYSKRAINQAIYSIIDAVKTHDPKVKNGCVLLAKISDTCIISKCENYTEYCASESNEEANPFSCLVIGSAGLKTIDATNKIKLVFLCSEHADLNTKGLGFDEILLMINRQKQRGYYFVELF